MFISLHVKSQFGKAFRGRSRSVSCFTEPLNLNGKIIVKAGHLFSFDIDGLVQDGPIESVYCKIKSGNGGYIEAFKKIDPPEIDYTPLEYVTLEK